MIAGIDIGYRAIKIVSNVSNHGTTNVIKQHLIQSVIGSPDVSTFSISNQKATTVTVDGKQWLIGQYADEQSRFSSRGQETRDWIHSEIYDVLIKTAIGWISTQTKDNKITIVTGLPVAYHSQDRDILKEQFMKVHTGKYCGNPFEINVLDCRVIPQPYGTLFSEVYDDIGIPINEKAYLLNNKVAILDIGSHTTNMQMVLRGDSLSKNSTSIAIGGWKLVQSVRERLIQLMPDLNPTDHQIAEALSGTISLQYYGEEIDIHSIAKPFAEQIAETITAAIGNTWGSAADVIEILVTGGGAYIIGDYINYPQAKIVNDPIFANAQGYYKFARRIVRQ